ncbi:MAG TPA: YciI family protein [Bauldia sp.]|nr:YciI family protein [Bauldia sp.]
MAYMMLIIEEPGERQRPPPAERQERWDRMVAFAGDLQSRGLLKVAESLALPNADTIRITRRGRNHAMVDGPFAEAKEIIGGIFLLDCDTREKALAIAEACPAVEWATVEVRRVAPCFVDAE